MARTKRPAPTEHAPLYDREAGGSARSNTRRPYDQDGAYSDRRAAAAEPEIITRRSAQRTAEREPEIITRGNARRSASAEPDGTARRRTAGQAKEMEIVIPLAGSTQAAGRQGTGAHTGARSTAHTAGRPAARGYARPDTSAGARSAHAMGYDEAEDMPAPQLRDRGHARVRRARRRRTLAFSVLLVLAVAVWAMFVYVFKIGSVTVDGNSIYNQSVIVECFGYRVGDNLFAFGRKAAAEKIAAALPYLETVTVTRHLPDEVVIKVTPSTETYSFDAAGTQVITSPSLKVLRQGDNTDGLLEIIGLALAAQTPGHQLEITDEAQAAALPLVLEALQADALPGVTQVDVSDVYNITLRCQGRFIVRLGTTVELDYKLRLVAETVSSRLAPDATGVVDVSSAATSRAAYYTPQPITED